MASRFDEGIERVEFYARTAGLSLAERLGFGQDGVVFSTSVRTAVKTYVRPELYERERDVYLRLRANDVIEAAGFNVPQLVNFDDELMIVEMTVVVPPFVLDFACAYIDEQPPYADDPEIMSYWFNQRREMYGEDWSDVLSVMSSLRAHGIHLADVKPGNVTVR